LPSNDEIGLAICLADARGADAHVTRQLDVELICRVAEFLERRDVEGSSHLGLRRQAH
jgi:hypothetical protein